MNWKAVTSITFQIGAVLLVIAFSVIYSGIDTIFKEKIPTVSKEILFVIGQKDTKRVYDLAHHPISSLSKGLLAIGSVFFFGAGGAILILGYMKQRVVGLLIIVATALPMCGHLMLYGVEATDKDEKTTLNRVYGSFLIISCLMVLVPVYLADFLTSVHIGARTAAKFLVFFGFFLSSWSFILGCARIWENLDFDIATILLTVGFAVMAITIYVGLWIDYYNSDKTEGFLGFGIKPTEEKSE